jgi:predicted extracellular nuclease
MPQCRRRDPETKAPYRDGRREEAMIRRTLPAVALALLAAVVGLATGAPVAHAQTPVFINEIHYDNAGFDTGEAVEIAGPAGTDISGWRIVRYNGANGMQFASPAAEETLPGRIPGGCGAFGVVVITYPQDGLQNGSPDGMALIDGTGAVVQFLSYEGAFTAVDGPAAGRTSTNIGVTEPATTPIGSSLQLRGTGQFYEDFTWAGPAGETFGSCNSGQTFPGDAPPSVVLTVPADGSVGIAADAPIGITFSEDVTASPDAFSIDCGAGSLGFSLSGGPRAFVLTPGVPLPSLASCTVTVLAAGVTDQDGEADQPETDTVFTFATAVLFACGEPVTRIHAIQGTGPASPLVGQTLDIEGIVVGAFQGTSGLLGFYVQEDPAAWDADPATSEGIFVFDNDFGVPVQEGDRVRARGRVVEFGTAGAALTELSSVTGVQVCSQGHAIPWTTVTLPVPSLDAWERFESMAVRLEPTLTVTETFNLGSFGEVVLATGRLANPTNIVDPGADAIALQALNDRSRLIVDDGSNLSRQNLDPGPYPENGGLAAGDPDRTVRVGDRVNAGTPLQGVLDQRFGSYRLQPTVALVFNPPDNPRPAEPPVVGGRVRVASFNVLNYFTTLDTGDPVCGPTGGLDCRGASSDAEFTRQRDKIVSALAALNGHVVGLIELENNASASLEDLVAGLNAATQPGRYAFIDTGTIGTDAIKVGFIYQPAVVTPVGTFAVLDGALDPRAITTLNRPALAQTFARRGSRASLQHFTVVVNHFKSKGSACATPQNPGELVDPDTGDGQGNCNLTRVSMAQALIDWLAGNPTGDPTPAARRKVLVIGDLNAYAREHPIQALTDPAFTLPDFPPNPNATYTNMVERFLGDEAYSFVFQGQSGYLDHALANPVLRPLVAGVAEWHVNADEPVALDYNLEWTAAIPKSANQQAVLYAPDPFRSADHDPLLVGLNPLCGDLDDDGDVDGRDLAAILRAIARRSYHPRMDYDGNGRVDGRDLATWVRCELEFLFGRFVGGAH